MENFLTLINTWYQSKCDGVWEHSYGFSLGNIDNLGWCIKITGENNKGILHITNSIDTEDY
ncbi:Imm53 family immunity protein [Ursidibacter sp. B-7004-1]